MNRQVKNQKERRAKLKEYFKDDQRVDVNDERTFYIP